MKSLILFIFTGFLLFSTYAQNEQDSAWLSDNYIKKEISIPMRDGVRLFTALYIPKNITEKHPFLLTRTPYSCAPYGEKSFGRSLWAGYQRYYVRENYIMVTQDVRGRWMSEGEFVDVRPFITNKKNTTGKEEIDESTDTYDTIDWLIKNINGNNGNVGVFGISYPGFYSTMAALCGHPALKAVSPQAPIADWFMGDDFHHNGAFFAMDCFSFYTSGFGYPHPKPAMKAPVSSLSIPENDNYTTYLRFGPIKNLLRLAGDSLKFMNDVFSHPDYDEWWKARNVRNFVSNIPDSTATLVVGGLFDAEDCFGAWRTYEAIEQKAKNNNKLVMGPWYHGQWSSSNGYSLGNIHFNSNTSIWYQNTIEIPFFNYYLKGKGELSRIAEASVFFSGSNEWKQFDRWPPAGKKDQLMFFQPGGKLSWDKPVTAKSFSEYISDPAKPVPYSGDIHFERTREYMTDDQRFADQRPDVLSFSTGNLDSDITIGGTVVANLLTSISTTDADFVVKLIDVFPDDFMYTPSQQNTAGSGFLNEPMGGYEMLVRGEIMRGRYRHSFTTPEAFKPNKTEAIKFELPDVAHTFKKGHRIMVQIQSSWFPLADRNPQKFVNIYTASESDFQKASIRIFHDAGNSSSITLPILK